MADHISDRAFEDYVTRAAAGAREAEARRDAEVAYLRAALAAERRTREASEIAFSCTKRTRIGAMNGTWKSSAIAVLILITIYAALAIGLLVGLYPLVVDCLFN